MTARSVFVALLLLTVSIVVLSFGITALSGTSRNVYCNHVALTQGQPQGQCAP